MIKKVALLLLLIIAMPIINSEIYGHTFTTDESVLFLTLVDKLKTHAKLTEQFVIGNNHESAIQHSNLLKQIYTKEINDEIEEKNERIANEISSFINIFSLLSSNNMTQSQINNTTIQALRIATLVNDIDINYADSFSTQPYNMSTMGMDQHRQNSSANESKDIQNYTAYQTAQELLVPVSQLFEEIRSEKEISNQDKVTQLKEGIDNLTTIIEMKKPYNEVAKVIHGIIQPTLQELYNLKIDIE